MNFHCIGFGSINIDEFWEAPGEFFRIIGISPGDEIVKEVDWFNNYYPVLNKIGTMKAVGPGGSAANTIAALNRMGFATGFFGSIGDDFHDKIDLDELGTPDHLQVNHTSCPTGRCLALIDPTDESRDRALVITPNANNLISEDLLDTSYFTNTSWVHLTSFVSSVALATQTYLVENLSGKTSLSFDPGLVYCRLGIGPLKPILSRSDVLFITNDELLLLANSENIEESVSTLFSLGVQTIVLKMGAKGIRAIKPDGRWFQEAVPPARIIDRTGAGDVVAAGFLGGLIQALPIPACLELAARAASRSLESYGRGAYPDDTFLKNFLSSRKDSFCSCI